MSDIQVTCNNKVPRMNTHEGIMYLGGYNWILTKAEVIRLIKSNPNTCFTKVGGTRADLGVAGHFNSHTNKLLGQFLIDII